MAGTSQTAASVLVSSCDAAFERCETFLEFARDILATATAGEPAVAAAVMEFAPARGPQFLAQQGLQKLSHGGTYGLDPEHVALMVKALQQQSVLSVARTTPPVGFKPHQLVIAPLAAAGENWRVVELMALPAPGEDRIPASQQADLKELAEILAGYLNRFQEREVARSRPVTTPQFWQQFDEFLVRLQPLLETRAAVAVAVNDARVLIGCDRVSIGLCRGPHIRITGVSGNESVQDRARLIQTMARLAEGVLALGTTVTYRGNVDEIPPQIERPLADYLAESRTRMVQLVPLRAPVPLRLEDEEPRPTPVAERSLLGVLIIEQGTHSRPQPGILERTELLVPHIEASLANCRKLESVFLLPVLERLGRGLRWFEGRRLRTALAVLAILFCAGVALAVIPYEYRVEGRGRAMPTVQHDVFAPWNARVQSIHIQSGQRVTAGELLLGLHSDELDFEETAATTELQEQQKLVLSLTQQQHAARRRSDQESYSRLEADFVKARIAVEGATRKLQRIQDRKQQLELRAPAAGVVVTFQLDQLLQNRPVQRGDLLLQLMEPAGDWRLEVEIPEYRTGHILTALNQTTTHELPVDYVLATAVETRHRGQLTEVANRSTESPQNGTALKAHVRIDPQDLAQRTIGAEVTARIHCGRKSLFYVLFGDVVEFVQRWVWL